MPFLAFLDLPLPPLCPLLSPDRPVSLSLSWTPHAPQAISPSPVTGRQHYSVSCLRTAQCNFSNNNNEAASPPDQQKMVTSHAQLKHCSNLYSCARWYRPRLQRVKVIAFFDYLWKFCALKFPLLLWSFACVYTCAEMCMERALFNKKNFLSSTRVSWVVAGLTS